jgi:phospholipid-translocating ATPase
MSKGVERELLSILVREKNTNVHTLYVRGTVESLANLINFENSDRDLEYCSNLNLKNGLKSIIFAKRSMSQKDANSYLKQYRDVKMVSLDQEEKLNQLAKSLEKDLELVAIVGVKTELRDGAKATVETLHKMGVKVNLLTGDSFENALNVSVELGIMANNNNYQSLDFSDVSGGHAAIKNMLEALKRTLVKQSQTDLHRHRTSNLAQPKIQSQQEIHNALSTQSMLEQQYMVISGRALEIIVQDDYLERHFKLLLHYSRAIIGYDLKPMHKGYILKAAKDGNPEAVNMTVGDGLNDLRMFQESDISVQLFHKHTFNVFGDLLLSDLNVIPRLMQVEGTRYSSNLSFFVTNTHFLAILLITFQIYFQFYSNFTAAVLIQSPLIYLIFIGHYLISAVFVLMEQMYPSKLCLVIPALYKERNYSFQSDFILQYFIIVRPRFLT